MKLTQTYRQCGRNVHGSVAPWNDHSAYGRSCGAPARVVTFILILTGMTACSRAPDSPQPRLVLLYATCSLNQNFLEPYNGAVSYTPNLKQFGEQGIVFHRHQTEAGQSGTGFASIFTGNLTHRHQIYYHPNKLADKLYLITEAFADAGYEPWFWSGHVMASADLNYGQGVKPEHVCEAMRPRSHLKYNFLQPHDRQFQSLLAKLEEDPKYRAFVVVNFTITHSPYPRQLPSEVYRSFCTRFPEEATGMADDELDKYWQLFERTYIPFSRDFPTTVRRLGLTESDVTKLAQALEIAYKADVAMLDTMFGTTLHVLEQKGLLDESLIAFTADHGEILYRENALLKWFHGFQLAPEVLSVPWIIGSPKHSLRLGDYDQVTRSIDVYPTLAGLCGIDVSQRGVEGTDLSAVLLGETKPPKQLAYSHSTVMPPEPWGFEKAITDSSQWLLRRYFSRRGDVGQIWVRIRDVDTVYKLRNFDSDVEKWGFEVFDLARDPEETTNLYDPADPNHAQMQSALIDYKEQLVSNFENASTESLPQAETKRRLRSLGYLGGSEED